MGQVIPHLHSSHTTNSAGAPMLSSSLVIRLILHSLLSLSLVLSATPLGLSLTRSLSHSICSLSLARCPSLSFCLPHPFSLSLFSLARCLSLSRYRSHSLLTRCTQGSVSCMYSANAAITTIAPLPLCWLHVTQCAPTYIWQPVATGARGITNMREPEA